MSGAKVIRVLAALAWAAICVVVTFILLAGAFGQSLDGIAESQAAWPLAGYAAILLAVAIAAFRHGLRAKIR